MSLRIAAIVEAKTVTGPAKNLIRFAAENRARVDFHFFTFARNASDDEAGRHNNPFIEVARRAGVPVSVIWERARFDRGVLPRLADCVLSFKPQLVQTHSVKSHFALARVARKIGVPWIAFHHGYTAEDLKMRVYNQLDRFSLPKAAAVITVCQAFACHMQRYGIPSERLHVLHNSLDPGWAQSPGVAAPAADIRARLPQAGALPVFLTVGRFSAEKGHEVLLRAAALLPSGSFTLLLVGDGPLRARIETVARRASLESSVIFAGQKTDVRPYFAAADALVLPSFSEGSPNALLEAMSAKVPIIATRVGGVPEMVLHNDSALLVPPGDAPALARAMACLMGDSALRNRLVEGAYRRLCERFSPGHYDARLLAIYDQALNRAV